MSIIRTKRIVFEFFTHTLAGALTLASGSDAFPSGKATVGNILHVLT